MDEIKRYEQQQVELNVDEIKKYIAPNATEKELFMFLNIAKGFNLNPFKREIYFTKYGDQAASIIVGYEVYIKRAERSGMLDGWKVWMDKDEIGEKAVIEIKRKDRSEPFVWEVYQKEFKKPAPSSGKATPWTTMPIFMLKKVAIAQGFRLCFSEECGGLPMIEDEHQTVQDQQRVNEPEKEKRFQSLEQMADEANKKFQEAEVIPEPDLSNIPPDDALPKLDDIKIPSDYKPAPPPPKPKVKTRKCPELNYREVPQTECEPGKCNKREDCSELKNKSRQLSIVE